MSEGRIYDDIFPLNVAGRYCCDMTSLIKDQLDSCFPDGWEANTHMLLMTHEGYHYKGEWHHDGHPQYLGDVIALLCLSGRDEIEYEDQLKSYLYPGECLLLAAAASHRGRCSTHRITYHCRVGPKGKIMPESPRDQLPKMTLRRFFGRTWRTIKYYALR